MDLTEFLSARLAEDKQRAKVAHLHPNRPYAAVIENPTIADFASTFDTAWTVASVLRSRESRLGVALTLYADAEALAAAGDPEWAPTRAAADAVARLAARSYADHPDFDEAWRIDG